MEALETTAIIKTTHPFGFSTLEAFLGPKAARISKLAYDVKKVHVMTKVARVRQSVLFAIASVHSFPAMPLWAFAL